MLLQLGSREREVVEPAVEVATALSGVDRLNTVSITFAVAVATTLRSSADTVIIAADVVEDSRTLRAKTSSEAEAHRKTYHR